MKLFAIEMIKVNSIQTNSQQPLQMERADLSGAQLQLHVAKDVCLDNGQLRKINLAGTTLVRCTFRNADLRQADLFGCELTEVDFSGADLRDADLRNTVRSNVVMTGANTSGTLMDSIETWKKGRSPRSCSEAPALQSTLELHKRGSMYEVKESWSPNRLLLPLRTQPVRWRLARRQLSY